MISDSRDLILILRTRKLSRARYEENNYIEFGTTDTVCHNKGQQ